MFRSLEITLSLPVVVPLLDPIRALATEIENAPTSANSRAGDALLEWSRLQPAAGELNALLGLFPPGFSEPGSEGVIVIAASEAPMVLRACALLRLHLRQRELGDFSDADLEARPVSEHQQYAGDQHAPLCYLFLATLQESLLSHRAPLPAPSKAAHWLQRVQAYFSPLRSDYVAPPKWTADTEVPTADESWEVIVHNDPVNLMSYVTAVFELTLGLGPEIAEQRMREVHEAKRSIVYQGSRQKAEGHAQTLRGWHLKAEARRCG